MLDKKSTIVSVGATALFAAASALIVYQLRRQQRSKWVEKELQEVEDEVIPSIIEHFREFQLDYGTSVEEANKRRTTNYYEKAREAHLYDLVLGVRNYFRLRMKREEELQRIMKRYHQGTKSHRTVIVMCDSYTQKILGQARHDILEPLHYSTDMETTGVWIPLLSIVPQEDLHVTVAIPWWWHTIRSGNEQLSRELVARFRQALVAEFHHPFQIELERIVLLGGKALVALWRCIGKRHMEDDGTIIYDRHGSQPDPFVKLRREIVRCFTTGSSDFGSEPLTYAHRFNSAQMGSTTLPEEPPPTPTRPSLERDNSIEIRTPGLGNHDGFIHTTLARLPLDCLSIHDVELAPIHRLCREATATYCGHRMVVSKFRFIESIGAGGESNPCKDPIFDETVDAPPCIKVTTTGGVRESTDLHSPKNVDRSATIGALPKTVAPGAVTDLFSTEEPVFEAPTETTDTLDPTSLN